MNIATQLRGAFIFFRNRFYGLGMVASFFLTPVWILLVASFFIYLGISVNHAYYAGILVIFPIYWSLSRRRRRLTHLRLQTKISKHWISNIDPDVDLELLHNQHAAFQSEADFLLDDASWHELELDSLFCRINRTFSTLGEFRLYHMLRAPLFDSSALSNRMTVLNLMQSDECTRLTLQLELSRLGKARRFNFSDLDSVSQAPPKYLRLTTTTLFASSVGVVALGAFFPKSPVLALAVCLLLVNLVFSSWFRWLLFWRVSTFVYLGAAITCAARVAQIKNNTLRPYTQRLGELSEITKEICPKAQMLEREESSSTEVQDLVIQYIRSFLLLDVSDYFKLIALATKHKASILTLLALLGDLDALQAIASFRHRLPQYCEPEFLTGGELVLECQDCCHPLVESGIANSLALKDANAFITGSNTSGKSTFLRSIALNAIMAQTTCTVSARKYKAPLFITLTSISIQDDLSQAKSFYHMEAERMLNILVSTEGSRPILCVLDEPLKGTNSPEALCATIEILQYLSRKNAITLVASHHVQIVQDLPSNYLVFHFTAPASGNPEGKNYVLQTGLDYKFNGLDTLEHVGFPAVIVNNARKRMERFLATDAASPQSTC